MCPRPRPLVACSLLSAPLQANAVDGKGLSTSDCSIIFKAVNQRRDNLEQASAAPAGRPF